MFNSTLLIEDFHLYSQQKECILFTLCTLNMCKKITNEGKLCFKCSWDKKDSNVPETRRKEPHYMMDLYYTTWHINLKVINIEPNGLGSRWSIAMDNDWSIKLDHFQVFVIYINLPMWTHQHHNIHCSYELPNMRLELC